MAKKGKNQEKGGGIIPRGRSFTGVIVSVSPHKSAVAEWEWRKHMQKYERYEKKKTRISVHNPPEINAKKGDKVLISECRPLSKTKKFIITKIVGKEELFAEKERLMEEAKVKTKEEKKEELAAEKLAKEKVKGTEVKQ